MNTYQIKDSAFYDIAEKSSCEILHYADYILSPYYDKMDIHTESQKINFVLDALILGEFWNCYNKYATIPFLKQKKYLLQFLYSLRYVSIKSKSFFDSVRGYLASVTITKPSEAPANIDLESISRLTDFMDATTEFKEESIRIKYLSAKISKLSRKASGNLLLTIMTLADKFREISKENLSDYTQDISVFLETHHDTYFRKENYFFTGRSETEYFLNIIGANLLNMDLKEEFLNTRKKIVILPCCMTDSASCKAKPHEHGFSCVKCNPDCHVYDILDSLDCKISECILIKHSSNFSKQLKPWAHQKHTGLIGVACILNLLKGGYEMKKLDIPSQCVFLDYSGCKKHWLIDLPTNLKHQQLLKVLNQDHSLSQCDFSQS